MRTSPEVLIVGAGPAGTAAALRLARAGVPVMVIEGAEYAGAENWSGCVYHADGLLREDVLGRELWQQAPKERRVVVRSLFVHDGINAAGFDARAHGGNDFGEAWTVLRPRLDRWLASRAIGAGVTLITATTVTGLRYHADRVVGVNTDRGPVNAGVVFLAEGDAAGLLAREGLERAPAPHYAQGIKALFRLPPPLIEQRFRLNPGEGAAQEWLLRNGQLAGRVVPLNMTAFLYTNHDTLSLGVVLPLDRLAKAGVADHPHLFRRVCSLPVIASLIEGAQQIAYGAKVIRSGGLDETPDWVRDGLAVGGGCLGLGQEVPYPNFIGPAITSALAFADAVLRLRRSGSRYTREELQREYADALRDTPDFRNARLTRRWPAAIHGGPALFDHLPAFLGQMVDAASLPPEQGRAQRRRALGMQLARLRRDLPQALRLARELRPRLRSSPGTQPLQVQFLEARGAAPLEPMVLRDDPLLALAATAIGHFYGRRLPDLADRMAMIWRSMAGLPRALPRIGSLGFGALGGGAALLGDLTRYRTGRVTLGDLLLRPYYRYEERVRQCLDWGVAHRSAASPTAWIAPLERYRPDLRHVTVPVDLGVGAGQLCHVCPAEVYALAGPRGGVASQHENCIKCESCRVTVPGVDWNRSSSHRFAYRVPGDSRSGPDSSVTSTLEVDADRLFSLDDAPRCAWQRLYQALHTRPAMVTEEWPRTWAGLMAELPDDALTRPLVARLHAWLGRRAYGWMETEVRALLQQAQALPADVPAVRDAAAQALQRGRAEREHLKAGFPPQKLAALAHAPWDPSARAALCSWIAAARSRRAEAVEWLAGWSSALAWIAAGHYVAETWAGHPIDEVLAAPLWREQDGSSGWLSAAAQRLVAPDGSVSSAGVVVAHGAGLDAAQPVRRRVDGTVQEFPVSAVFAEMTVALACGQASVLRRRALDYAATRVQFHGELRDCEGRDSIAKFGIVKQMLAGVEHACMLLDLARGWCAREPAQVLLLVRGCMGPWMDAVPWLAGQIFGGMAYSEEDILAPRYRDAIQLSQWPGSRETGTEDPEFGAQLIGAMPLPGPGRVVADGLRGFAEGRQRIRRLRPPTAEPQGRRMRPQRPLIWDAHASFAYLSGSFLTGHLLAPDALLVPEHFRRDPSLRSTRAGVLRLLRRGFRSPDRNEPYGRYIDSLHAMPQDDVQLLREFNAFATIVPTGLGGKGWSKAQYSVLTNLCMGAKDTATGLLIMASTSIGTMPVLLGRDKDLPRLRREIDICLSDAPGWQELQDGIDELLRMIAHPEPARMRRMLEQLGAAVQRMMLFPGSTLKYLARDFLLTVQQVVDAAKSHDLAALTGKLRQCRDGLPALRSRFAEERDEAGVRLRAHDRFLQFLACGQISAFALTEPAAGSDTGGIQTRAVLHEVEAQPDGPGFYRFTVPGTARSRLLLDAANLVFESRRALFRMPDGRLATLDDSDWDMARNSGVRQIRIGDRSWSYDDIGTVVVRDGRTYYRYWELTGSKMWITNGSIADRYCIYARTAAGETGFMLERRSEGLRIGPDENKLGQRASPTNELRLDRVRVSADQVIGFAGHGQVNALETLSVGRGGLVMSCATLAERVLQEFLPVWRRDPQLHAVAQAECDRLQTLAARLVGLMDRADLARGDFRIEAALSKYLASEGAHRILGWLDRLYGPDAAAREVMLEKWRRDIRILNIYEGTNEVQRFLVLKDLPGLVGASAVTVADNAPLDAALRTFREFASGRVAASGSRVWQDPDLQVRWFPVVDWAAELYGWVALHERIRLLKSLDDPADRADIERLQASEASIARHVQDVAAMVRAEFSHTDHGEACFADAALVLARAALLAPPATEDRPVAAGAPGGEWAVVLRSRFEPAGEGLAWAGWHAADLAVLDRLLSWSDRFAALRVKVAAVGPDGIADALRRLQAAGAEVLHVVQPAGAAGMEAVARILRRAWPQVRRWAFGRDPASLGDQCHAAHLAQLLSADLLENATAVGPATRGLRVETGTGITKFIAAQRAVAFAWALRVDGRADRFTIRQWLETLHAPPPAHEAAAGPVPAGVRIMTPRRAGDLPERFADAQMLADWLRARFGAGAVLDRPAMTRAVDAPLPGGNLWITVSDALSGASRSPALRAIAGLESPFGVLAWHASGQEPRPPSVMLGQAGFTGLWQLPLRGGAAPPAALAAVLAAPAAGPHRIVFDADYAAVAAALAARLRLPLFEDVIRIGPDAVTSMRDGYEADYPLPQSALLVISRSLDAPSLVTPSAAPVAVCHLPAGSPASTALERLAARAPAGAGLSSAGLIVDVGLGAAILPGQEQLVSSLCTALARLSNRAVEIGATRKVTQELKLLQTDRQIGQTGVSVAPELLLALGISGAPQHMGWIDAGAIVIAINRDPDAPIFSWPKEHPGPRVIACVGDLEEWIPALLRSLGAGSVAEPVQQSTRPGVA